MGETTEATDLEVFRRWVEEGGLKSAVEEVLRAKSVSAERVKLDTQIVFGNREAPMKRAMTAHSRALANL